MINWYDEIVGKTTQMSSASLCDDEIAPEFTADENELIRSRRGHVRSAETTGLRRPISAERLTDYLASSANQKPHWIIYTTGPDVLIH